MHGSANEALVLFEDRNYSGINPKPSQFSYYVYMLPTQA